MKKLTEKEVSKMKVKPAGRGSYARDILVNMAAGDIVLIEPADWNQTSKTPSTMCRTIEKQMGWKFKCDKALDGSGWIVRRLS